MNKLFILIIFLSLAIFSLSIAESQGPPDKRDNQRTKGDSITNKGNEKLTFPVTTIISLNPMNQSQNPDNTSTTNNNKSWYNSIWEKTLAEPINIYTLGLTFFTLVLAISTIGLWIATTRTTRHTKIAAEAAQKSADASLQAATANMFTTRAYVRISTCPPGIIFIEQPIPQLTCRLEIKNYGETPAHITDIVIQAKISEIGQLLPDIPDFDNAKRYPCSNAFLVRGESISYHFFNDSILTKTLITDIKDGKSILNLYGQVDYIDTFGNRHRGGFGQNYYPAHDQRRNYSSDEAFTTRNNLTFLMQADYNYDRPINDSKQNC